MQNENLKKNEKSEIVEAKRGSIFSQIDLDTKKEIAKIGMTASMGITVATSFYMKNKFMKNLHIGAGVALVGFSFWHHMLYQPNKNQTIQTKETLNNTPLDEQLSISLNEFYIELSIDGKLTAQELINFEDKIEALLDEYSIPSMNILIDIRELEGVELEAIYEDFVFAIKHFNEFNKIAIVGNKKFEEYSVGLTDKIVPFDMKYFEDYEEAHNWLLA